MIREATIEDLGAVCALTGELEETEFEQDPFTRIYAEKLASEHDLVLVNDHAGRVRGYIHLRFERQLHHTGLICEVMELVVSDTARGAGLGGGLIEAAIEQARSRGCEDIELTSNAKRVGAHAFYEAHGFNKTHVKLVMDL